MKRILILACCGIAAFYGCKCSSNTAPAEEPLAEPQAQEQTALTAVSQYLNDLAANYAPGEYSIPYCLLVGTDDTNPDDIQIWGDFWVENYNQAGDTLKAVSGGSHPGCMHVKKTEEGFEVTRFEAVGDGSELEPTAKAIFGDKYDAFMALTSNDEAKRTARAKSILDYAAANNLAVSYYQDFGWPAVKIK